ncbi:hypothetical protein F4777DRAFT_593519 [Nemania sp. FL0916]|nr:hypothetical protein F4777DRAFT_593519 [Nemania sp. FL0916]
MPTGNGALKADELLSPELFPFVECYRHAVQSDKNGVVQIHNLPFDVMRSDIMGLIGRSAKILNDRDEPVHIIMDRVTSKTMEVFVELANMDAAMDLVNRFKRDRAARVGMRAVHFEMSSQSVLMQALFPSTKYGVVWDGSRPQIITDAEHSIDNFKGFLTEEQMNQLVKHTRHPLRSPYAKTAVERPYECMISTLRKMPWYEPEHITIHEREVVYNACLEMIRILRNYLQRPQIMQGTELPRLTQKLLDRLVISAMVCPGFSVVQKHNIASTVGLDEQTCLDFNQPRYAHSWCYSWILCPKQNVPMDLIEWYIMVIRNETNRAVQSLTIDKRMALHNKMRNRDTYWGFYWLETGLPIGKDFDKMTLAECARIELLAMERVITRAINGGRISPRYDTAQ